MSDRWSTDDAWSLAPDASSRKAAMKVAKPGSWPALGWRAAAEGQDGPGGASVVWGECAGSGSKPYQTAVDLTAPGNPAYHCSCPSRKFPCKHALALLVLWAHGAAEGPGDGPEWVVEWAEKRQAKAAAAATPAPRAAAARADPDAAAQRARRREERIGEGLAELELWLGDQVNSGLAELTGADYYHWDSMAARLVDSQAGPVAGRVRALAGVMTAPDWPHRVLSELALLRLLCAAYPRRDDLPPELRSVVREHLGLSPDPGTGGGTDPATTVRDQWSVLGRYDFSADNLRGRRFWLRGARSGRVAKLLSFAPQGRTPDSPVRVGTVIDAELDYSGSGTRAAVVANHGEQAGPVPDGGSVDDALTSVAAALAADPWCTEWPVVLSGAVMARENGWWLADPTGAALPLGADVQPWRVMAVSGGRPLTVTGEWTPYGLRLFTVWDSEGRAIPM